MASPHQIAVRAYDAQTGVKRYYNVETPGAARVVKERYGGTYVVRESSGVHGKEHVADSYQVAARIKANLDARDKASFQSATRRKEIARRIYRKLTR